MKRFARIDKQLALLLAILVVGGCLIFASAAFGLLARGADNISSVVLNHIALGVGLGIVALIITASIDLKLLRKFVPYLFAAAVLATAAVFIPHLGAYHGGGRRWIYFAGFSFQPSEALKIATILLAAGYFAGIKQRVASFTYGTGGFFAILALPALILVLQPDIGTLGVITIGVLAIYAAAGARLRDIALIIVIGFIALGALAFVKPYIMERVTTFLNPAQGQQDQSYQIRQSLIAIGSGEVFGRGFGQGVQKFTYLPEPMGDSIFAVAGEELGFVGALMIIGAFLLFTLRGITVGAHATDRFAGLLGIGIATYLGIEAFINIASMLGVAPLTGIPLTFISQGGSAMLMSLASAGLLINVSTQRRRTHTGA